jgi:predicted nucleic acid-binding protein
VTDSKLLDSSIWIDYLFFNSSKSIIENEETLYISTLSLFEIKKILLKKDIPSNTVQEKIDFIKERSISISINENISEAAAEISLNNNIPAIDSLIYTTAKLNNSKLITKDNDFRGLSNVTILET